jgi:hypothetical protein
MDLRTFVIATSLFLSTFASHAQNLCSTEKVNHDDCTVYVSRRYPVTLPTIQMKPGKKVIVVVTSPLDFESLSLDWTSGTALPPTDQGAALVTAVIPDLKGLYSSEIILPGSSTADNSFSESEHIAPNNPVIPTSPDPCSKEKKTYNQEKCAEEAANKLAKDEKKVQDDLDTLRLLLKTARNNFKTSDVYSNLPGHVVSVYAQLNQALSPIPKPGFVSDKLYEPPPPALPGAASLPKIDPWTDYGNWREMMLCELAGLPDSSDHPRDCPSETPFNNLLGDINALQGRLPTPTVTVVTAGVKPAATKPEPDPNQLFDQKLFDYLVKQTIEDIGKLSPVPAAQSWQATDEGHTLQQFQAAENLLTSRIAALSNTLTNVQKDFVTYYQNILQLKTAPAGSKQIGYIYDPAVFQRGNTPVSHPRLLGRQVVYSVNAVNQISTPLASITATTAKIAVATVTVLFADPIFETSAGGLVSFVHNRTFANQTVITPQPGTSQQAGEIIISQTKTDPEVVPFVAGHWRLFPDFTMPDQRRGAVYGTVWVGLNPYTTLPEYGAGPTLSWRSFMFSALYNRAHVVGLTAPQTLGETVCNPTAIAGASPPPCTPAPPAPITQTGAINAFAIGISIRLPTTFTAGTGGVSH